MKSIQLHIPALLGKIQEMSNDRMEYVALTISDEVIDQGVVYPSFIHFEAYTGDGCVVDYESIDALNLLDARLEQKEAG